MPEGRVSAEGLLGLDLSWAWELILCVALAYGVWIVIPLNIYRTTS